MPKPVRNRGTDAESLWEWAGIHSRELRDQFEQGYQDAGIIGGECRRCFSHVIEHNDEHKRWHKEMNFAVWIMGSAWRAATAEQDAIHRTIARLKAEARTALYDEPF